MERRILDLNSPESLKQVSTLTLADQAEIQAVLEREVARLTEQRRAAESAMTMFKRYS